MYRVDCVIRHPADSVSELASVQLKPWCGLSVVTRSMIAVVDAVQLPRGGDQLKVMRDCHFVL